MKNCHDEQLFIWSSKSQKIGGSIESTGEEFPEVYGIEFRQEYYMMMVIYEYVDTELIDNSGLRTFQSIILILVMSFCYNMILSSVCII